MTDKRNLKKTTDEMTRENCPQTQSTLYSTYSRSLTKSWRVTSANNSRSAFSTLQWLVY